MLAPSEADGYIKFKIGWASAIKPAAHGKTITREENNENFSLFEADL